MAACVATPKSCGTCMFVVTGIYENAIIVWAQRYILCFGAFFPYRKDSRGCFVSRRPWGPFFPSYARPYGVEENTSFVSPFESKLSLRFVFSFVFLFMFRFMFGFLFRFTFRFVFWFSIGLFLSLFSFMLRFMLHGWMLMLVGCPVLRSF